MLLTTLTTFTTRFTTLTTLPTLTNRLTTLTSLTTHKSRRKIVTTRFSIQNGRGQSPGSSGASGMPVRIGCGPTPLTTLTTLTTRPTPLTSRLSVQTGHEHYCGGVVCNNCFKTLVRERSRVVAL